MAKKKDSLRQEVRNRGESRFETSDYSENPYGAQSARQVQRDEILASYVGVHDNQLRRTNRALKALNDMRNEFYAGIDPRRREELSNAGMVQEDRHEIANLSSRFVHREYPKAGYYSTPYLDDMREDD